MEALYVSEQRGMTPTGSPRLLDPRRSRVARLVAMEGAL